MPAFSRHFLFGEISRRCTQIHHRHNPNYAFSNSSGGVSGVTGAPFTFPGFAGGGGGNGCSSSCTTLGTLALDGLGGGGGGGTFLSFMMTGGLNFTASTFGAGNGFPSLSTGGGGGGGTCFLTSIRVGGGGVGKCCPPFLRNRGVSNRLTTTLGGGNGLPSFPGAGWFSTLAFGVWGSCDLANNPIPRRQSRIKAILIFITVVLIEMRKCDKIHKTIF
jgi:hypothetical protein